jgi:starvation-inducible DNA-binding protein
MPAAKGRKSAATNEAETQPTRIGTNSPTVAESLKGFAADTYMLLAKTQAAHWNMTGANFIGLHKLTEEQYRELFEAADELAERVRALGQQAPLSVAEMMSLTRVEELTEAPDTVEAVEILAADNAMMSRRARELAEEAEENDDPATHDMLAARVEAHDKNAWLLRANLPPERADPSR